MKKNDFEKDIKIIESIVEEYESCSVPEIDMQVDVTFGKEQNSALKHILSDYKKVMNELKKYKNMYEAEHEIHKTRNEQLERKENSIQSALKVKNKFEELKLKLKDKDNDKYRIILVISSIIFVLITVVGMFILSQHMG